MSNHTACQQLQMLNVITYSHIIPGNANSIVRLHEDAARQKADLPYLGHECTSQHMPAREDTLNRCTMYLNTDSLPSTQTHPQVLLLHMD